MRKYILRDETGKPRVIKQFEGPSKTQQQFKEQCNINNIIKKYRATGEITHVSNRKGAYMDLTELPSYQEALHTVMQASDTFLALPAQTRKRFGNDPQQLIEFLADKNNLEESYKLGLREKPPTPPVDKMDTLIETIKSTNQNTTKTKSTKT